MKTNRSLKKFSLRKDGSHVDTTHTVAIRDKDSNIALFTPGGTPSILDDPVFSSSAIFDSITNKKNSMI